MILSRLSQGMRSRLAAMLLLGLDLLPRGVSQVAANFSANSAAATSATASVAANASATFSASASMVSSSSCATCGGSGARSKVSASTLASLQARASSLSSEPMSRLSSSAISSAVANLYSAGNQGTLSASESSSGFKSAGTSRSVVAPIPKLGAIKTGVRHSSGAGMGVRSGLMSGFSSSSLSSSGLSGGFSNSSSMSSSVSSSNSPRSSRFGSHDRTSKSKKQSRKGQLGLPQRQSLHEQLKDQLSNDTPQQ